MGGELDQQLRSLEREISEFLRPHHRDVPFGMDHYFLTIKDYEEGKPFGPLGLSAGPGIGIASCYRAAAKAAHPDAPEVGDTEWFSIVAAGDQICWTLAEDLESQVSVGLKRHL